MAQCSAKMSVNLILVDSVTLHAYTHTATETCTNRYTNKNTDAYIYTHYCCYNIYIYIQLYTYLFAYELYTGPFVDTQADWHPYVCAHIETHRIYESMKSTDLHLTQEKHVTRI